MTRTNHRETRPKPDKAHQEVTAHIKKLPSKLPDGFSAGEVTTAYLDYLEELFKRHGFETKREIRTVDKGAQAITVYVQGQRIRAAFGNAHAPSLYYAGRLTADSSEGFDKWSRCPLVVRLPLTIRREAEVLEYLRVLASGDETGNYPREIDY